MKVPKQKARLSLGDRDWSAGLYAFCAIVLFFLVAPVFIIVPLSFSSAPYLTFPPPGFSLRWYESYLFSRQWQAATLFSFELAAIVTLLATVLGTMAAISLVRGRFPAKRLIGAFLLSPMFVPIIIIAIGIYYMYAEFHLIGSAIGMVLAHTVLAVPFVIVTVSAALRSFDESLEHAARTLGAGPVATVYWVTLPLIKASIVTGALLAFMTSFDEVVVAIFISGSSAITLPKQMWDGVRNEINPTISAVASLLIGMSVVSFASFVLLARWIERSKPAERTSA